MISYGGAQRRISRRRDRVSRGKPTPFVGSSRPPPAAIRKCRGLESAPRRAGAMAARPRNKGKLSAEPVAVIKVKYTVRGRSVLVGFEKVFRAPESRVSGRGSTGTRSN